MADEEKKDSFTNQKPFEATIEWLRDFQSHQFDKRECHCSLCGYQFVAGDMIRWVYMNGYKTTKPNPGNFFICTECDTPGDPEQVRRDAVCNYSDIVSGARRWNSVLKKTN